MRSAWTTALGIRARLPPRLRRGPAPRTSWASPWRAVSGSSGGGPYTYDIRLSVNGATLQVLDDYSFSETLWGRTWLEANSDLDVYKGEGYDIAAIYLQDDKKKDHSAFIESEDLYLSACEELGITPIPEPTALALLALGAVGLALRRRVA